MLKALKILLWLFVLAGLMAASFLGGAVFGRLDPANLPTELWGPAHAINRLLPPPPVAPAVEVRPGPGGRAPGSAARFLPRGAIVPGGASGTVADVLLILHDSGAVDAPGRSVRIGGRVLGPVTAQSVVVEANGSVVGKVTASDSVVVEGSVAGDVDGATVILRPSAEIVGNVLATASLTVESGAVVSGRLTPPEGQTVRVAPPSSGWFGDGVRPRGPVLRPPSVRPVELRGEPPVIIRTTTGGWPWVAGFFGLIALGTMAFAFFGDDASQVADTATQRPARYLTRGLLAVLIAPPVLAVTAATVVGIPLAIAGAAILAAAVAVGISAIGLFVGRKVSVHLPDGWNVTPLMQVVLGALLLVFALAIPILGALLVGLGLLVGFGGVADLWYPRLREAWRRWRQRPRSGGDGP